MTTRRHSISLLDREMAVSRYNGLYIASGGCTDFTLWLILSVAVHLFLAILIILFPATSRNVFYTPAYEVELFPAVRPEGVSRKEEVRPIEKPSKKRVKELKKAKKEDARPDKVIVKFREKVAAEEAVEKIRKKVRNKETVSSRDIRIASTPPARVYRYEELDKELQAYYDKIALIIRNAWSLPEILSNKGYKTILSIHISRDGTIQSLWIEKGSGNRFYDESTLRAVKKVSPLPPLPKGWKERFIDLGFNF